MYYVLLFIFFPASKSCTLPSFSSVLPPPKALSFPPRLLPSPRAPLPRSCGGRGVSSAPAPSRNALRNSPAPLSGQKAPPGTASGARLPRRQHLSRGNAGGNGIKLLAMRGCKQNNPKARAGTLPEGAKAIGGGVCSGSQHGGRRAAGSRGAFHHPGAALGERSGAPTSLPERWITFGTGGDRQEFVSGWGQSFFFFFFRFINFFFFLFSILLGVPLPVLLPPVEARCSPGAPKHDAAAARY